MTGGRFSCRYDKRSKGIEYHSSRPGIMPCGRGLPGKGRSLQFRSLLQVHGAITRSPRLQSAER